MWTAQLQLSDFDTRVNRIEAMLGDPVASSSLLHEACSDTPIVGEILATFAFAQNTASAGNQAKAREDARRTLVIILAFRELEREAARVCPLPDPPERPFLDILFAVLNCLEWIGRQTRVLFCSVFSGRQTQQH